MTLVPIQPEYYDPDRLLSPKETVDNIHILYGIQISLASFYTMISRKEGPKPTYFRGRPKFTIADIDKWVRGNLSDHR
jgi:predicted DNA-binding transcriptional regulator AlpA